MKKTLLSLSLLFLAIVTGITQVITVPEGTTGTFYDSGTGGGSSGPGAVNKQFNISTGTNVSIELTITGNDGYKVVPYHGVFIFYECDNSFSSLREISRCSDYTLPSVTITTTSPNGKMVVVYTYDGCCGAYAFTCSYRPTSATAVNNFNTTGPVNLAAYSSAAPNLTIDDFTSKNMGSIYSTTTDYTKSMLLMKSGTYQLGLGANKISANNNLGISSTGVLSQNASNFVFSTATVPYAFNITSTGNVLVGKTTQTVTTNKLDVNGNVSATKFIGDGAGLTGIKGLSQWTSIPNGIYYGDGYSGYVGIGETDPKVNLDIKSFYDVPPVIRLNYSDGTQYMWDFENDGNLLLKYGTTYTSTKVIFAANGNVGIGTSSLPSQKLEVNGTIKATKFIGEGASQWITGGDNIYYNTGSVGIGTSTPSNLQGWSKVLDVRGDGHSKILATTANETYKTGIFSHSSWNGGGGFIGTESGHPLYLIAGYDPKMTILTNGNVGIGITTPDAQLHLADIYSPGGKNLLIGDDAYLTDIDVANTLGVYGNGIQTEAGLRLGSSGSLIYGKNSNILIGKNTQSNTSYKLDVSGNAAFSGRVTTNDLVIDNTSSVDYNYALFLKVRRDMTKAFGIESKDGKEVFRIYGNGIVNAKKIYAEEIEVRPDAFNIEWFDHVFAPEYKLLSLKEVEKFIKEKSHLPDIPSEAQVKNDGINLAKMDGLLLKKIEELTLYIIEQEKRMEEMKGEIDQLKRSK